MVTIVLDLDTETEREARLRGLLSSEKITKWIEHEVREEKRRESAQKTRLILDQLDALEPKLTEAEIAEELGNRSTSA